MFSLLNLTCYLVLSAFSNAQITLGTVEHYGVLAGSTITNTGATVINSKIGISPGTSITGFPPGITRVKDVNNDAAKSAKADLQAAYSTLFAMHVDTYLTGQNLGGKTLTSGVYGFTSGGALAGNLVLDAEGDPSALFVFRLGTTLVTSSASTISLVNGAQGCNVYWQVGSSASLGTGTRFIGNILAQASITANTGVVVNGGGLYALTGAVTLDDDTISPLGSCGSDTTPGSSTTTTTSSPSTGGPDSVTSATVPRPPITSILTTTAATPAVPTNPSISTSGTTTRPGLPSIPIIPPILASTMATTTTTTTTTLPMIIPSISTPSIKILSSTSSTPPFVTIQSTTLTTETTLTSLSTSTSLSISTSLSTSTTNSISNWSPKTIILTLTTIYTKSWSTATGDCDEKEGKRISTTTESTLVSEAYITDCETVTTTKAVWRKPTTSCSEGW